MNESQETQPKPEAGLPLGAAPCSASDYNPAQCLWAEVRRFKATNRFTPMEVTGFYIQAAVVLDEHRTMAEALHAILNVSNTDKYIRHLAARALPMSETPRTPNDASSAT